MDQTSLVPVIIGLPALAFCAIVVVLVHHLAVFA
jgi:hypothetical protein